MLLNAICLVKNEADVIRQSLAHAARFCDAIYVLDNGSTDGTWEAVQALAESEPRVVPFGQTLLPFDNNHRGIVYDAIHADLSDDDWWLVLDGDEFLAEDPRPIIRAAAATGADVVNAWQALFYFTDEDHRVWQGGMDSRERPIFERRRYYRIDEQERRLFRNRTRGTWLDSALLRRGKKCHRRIVNRHYRYRDPLQIEARLGVRFGHPAFATQVSTRDYTKLIRSTRGLTLRRDGDPWRFTVAGMLAYVHGWTIPVRRRLRKAVARRQGLALPDTSAAKADPPPGHARVGSTLIWRPARSEEHQGTRQPDHCE